MRFWSGLPVTGDRVAGNTLFLASSPQHLVADNGIDLVLHGHRTPFSGTELPLFLKMISTITLKN